MVRDPHELQPRMPAFQHDDSAEAFLEGLNEALALASLAPMRRSVDPSTLPIVYIVGAPRSGTTLLSQVISRHLEVGYVDNVVARFWRRPSVGIRLSQILLGERRRECIEFRSQHGVSEGLAGPHEFGYFWRHWLQCDAAPTHHPTPNLLTALDAGGLRAQLHDELLAAFAQPAVFKNVICGFYAPWLTMVHPRSLFVHIERDLAQTAASILATRFARYGAYEAWWSLKPSTFEELSNVADPAMQVVRQVTDSRREFAAALTVAPVRSLRVGYDELCDAPDGVLSRVASALKELGAEVKSAGVPSPLCASGAPPLPSHLQARLESALREVA